MGWGVEMMDFVTGFFIRERLEEWMFVSVMCLLIFLFIACFWHGGSPFEVIKEFIKRNREELYALALLVGSLFLTAVICVVFVGWFLG